MILLLKINSLIKTIYKLTQDTETEMYNEYLFKMSERAF